MAFVFRFEKLLRIKQMKEETLQREYFSFASDYRRSMNELLVLKNERDEAIERKKAMERNGCGAAQFDIIENFLYGNKARCIMKIDEIKKKRKLLDLKKRELDEARKERAVFDKLKEKAYKVYQLDKEKREVNRLDEISTIYFGRNVA